MPRQKTPIDQIAAQLGPLSLDELLELQSMIAVLIQHRQREAEEPETDLAGAAGATQNGSGYVEAKMINGYGPYLYMRYRHAGKHHSKYIGKPQVDG